MARLAGTSVNEVLKDPVACVQEQAGKYKAVFVLKGAHSLIGYPDRSVRINLSGNSGMASAGSGDVLTGTIAAMAGLGLAVEEAVPAGVFIHGLAGDLASNALGEDSITARSLLDALPEAMKKYRNEHNSLFENYYGKIFLI
jgi:NAD(P)H-hydrate epimerase